MSENVIVNDDRLIQLIRSNLSNRLRTVMCEVRIPHNAELSLDDAISLYRGGWYKAVDDVCTVLRFRTTRTVKSISRATVNDVDINEFIYGLFLSSRFNMKPSNEWVVFNLGYSSAINNIVLELEGLTVSMVNGDRDNE